jgi:uncharacterized integral membrane protein
VPESGGTEGPPGRGRIEQDDARTIAKIAAIVLGVVLLLVFIVENTDQVTVSFVFFEAELSLIWVIVLSAVVGWVVGFTLARLIRRRFFSGDA